MCVCVWRPQIAGKQQQCLVAAEAAAAWYQLLLSLITSSQRGKKWIMKRKRETKWKQNKTEGSEMKQKASLGMSMWASERKQKSGCHQQRVKRKCKRRGRELQKNQSVAVLLSDLCWFLYSYTNKKSGFHKWGLWFEKPDYPTILLLEKRLQIRKVSLWQQNSRMK